MKNYNTAIERLLPDMDENTRVKYSNIVRVSDSFEEYVNDETALSSFAFKALELVEGAQEEKEQKLKLIQLYLKKTLVEAGLEFIKEIGYKSSDDNFEAIYDYLFLFELSIDRNARILYNEKSKSYDINVGYRLNREGFLEGTPKVYNIGFNELTEENFK